MKSLFYTIFFLYFLCPGHTKTLKSQTILNNDTLFNLSPTVNDSITIHYIGCSGFFIKKGNDIVLVDPYFSNKKTLSYFFGHLTNKKTISADLKGLIDFDFSHIIQDTVDHAGLIKTLLVSHGHIDHYGDVPYLFQSDRFNLDTIKIIGNTTTQYYLAGDSIPDKNIIKQIEPATQNDSIEDKWIYVNNKIRILPIIGEHAPHLKILGMDINFVSQKKETEKIHHKYWRQYASGQSLAYLIDFLNTDGSTNFRVYHSSSAVSFPYGFPAQSVLNQHPVDIAMLCVASFSYIKNYPVALVNYLKPKHIITCHWEDFLNYSIPELKIKPKTVPATNIKKFFSQLDEVLLNLNTGTTYIQPNVNTTIKYFYSNK